MRAIVNGKPGWRYGLLLFVGVFLLALALRYGLDGTLQRDALELVLLFASGFALLTTLLHRAAYNTRQGEQRPPSAGSPHDAPTHDA